MTNQNLWERLASRDSHIRAADADRERTADRLRKSHTEGRLDMAEFQERLERCYQAKTLGELGELVSDLPRQDELEPRRASGWLVPWGFWRLAPLAPVLLAVIIASAITGHHGFWLWIPVAFVLWRMSWWRRRRWAAGRRGPGHWI